MKIIGAALELQHDGSSACVTEFRSGVAREYSHLLQRVNVRGAADSVVDGIVDVHAVEHEVVRLLTIAVHIRASAETRVHTRRIGADEPGINRVSETKLRPFNGSEVNLFELGSRLFL